MPALFTTAGLTLFQTDKLANMATRINRVDIGTLAAGDKYNPTVGQTGLVDTNPVSLTTDIDLTGAGPRVQYRIRLEHSSEIIGSEVGFFSDSTLVAVWADDTDELFTKPAGDTALVGFGYNFASGTPSNLTIDLVAASTLVIAGQSTAEAGSNNTEVMTPLRVKQYIDGRLASDAEVEDGTNDTRLVTPADVKASIEHNRPSDFRNIHVSTSAPDADSIWAVGDIWLVIES